MDYASKSPSMSSPIKSIGRSPMKSPRAAVTGRCTASNFTSVDVDPSIRILKFPKSDFQNFAGLTNFPNLRILDLRNNKTEFSIRSILVAFRSFFLAKVNGVRITDQDFNDSFRYSSLVTFALRAGYGPELPEDADVALNEAIAFLYPNVDVETLEDKYKFVDDDITRPYIVANADLYSWSVLDDNFQWKNLDTNNRSITTNRNSVVKCVVKAARNTIVIIPEFDKSFHIYAELVGEPVEGGLISVKAPLSSQITWRHVDDEINIAEGSLVLAIRQEDIGRVIACDIQPAPGLPTTRLITQPIKPGEFRFKSIKMQGQLVQDDEIEFDVSTRGTKAVFKGVRILRSARHGEWENVTTISDTNNLKYLLTVYDVGCVMRAICLVEGGGTPLMITSSERVQPSSPMFTDPVISGVGIVGSPLFAIATYRGGVQGSCKYEWNVGPSNDRNRPVVVPTEADAGKPVQCKMTPVRSDGSIGKPVIAEYPAVKSSSGQRPLREIFVGCNETDVSYDLYHTLQKPSKLYDLKEGKKITLNFEAHWAVINHDMIHTVGSGAEYTPGPEFLRGIVVAFTDDEFVVCGVIVPSDPRCTNLRMTFDEASFVLTAHYNYLGGIEGRSVIQWNKRDRSGKETVCSFGRSYIIKPSDIGSKIYFIVTPLSLDGKKGKQCYSHEFHVAKNFKFTEEIPLVLTPPDEIREGQYIEISQDYTGSKPDSAVVLLNRPLHRTWMPVWSCGHDVVSHDLIYKPTTNDFGIPLNIKIVDRLSQRIVAEVELPLIRTNLPTITGVRLTVQKGVPQKDRSPTLILTCIYDKYQGGVQGTPFYIWKARIGDDDFKEIIQSERNFIEINHQSFAMYQFLCEIVPKDMYGNTGYSIPSNIVDIPSAAKPDMIDIETAHIEVDENFETFTCVVKTNGGQGTLEYTWGYFVENKEAETDIHTISRPVVKDDFIYPPFCRVVPVSPLGEVGDKALVFLPMEAKQLFTPVIQSCVINSKDNKCVNGNELRVDVTYIGPPITETAYFWQVLENDQWVDVSDENVYTPTYSQIGKLIRVKIFAKARAKILDQPIMTETFISEPVKVSPNQTFVRLANALKRSRAVFEAQSTLGENVTVNIDGSVFTLKTRTNTLLKCDVNEVTAVCSPEDSKTCILTGKKNYQTEISFKSMRTNGGYKLTPLQTREFFIETVNRFKK